MRLKARLDKLEANMEWLQGWGHVRHIELALEYFAAEKRLAEHKARLAEKARAAEAARTAPPKPAATPISPPEKQEAVREASFADVVRVPPPSWPPPPPLEKWETHDIPEHRQIRPVTWRVRGLADEDDWEDGGHDPTRALTEYDPIEDDS